MDPPREIQTTLTLTILPIIDLLVNWRSLKKKTKQQNTPSTKQTPPKLWK